MSQPKPDVTQRVEDSPSPVDVAYVEDQLNAYNIRVTGYDDYRPLAVFIRDASSAILAGLTGYTWGGALKIEYIWVHDDYRGNGYGTQLIHAAEREALTRGCHQAVLDTHSFQAPDFYSKLGYAQCGLAQDWPLGHQQYYFTKRLG
ncbi:MAG TPA: GNAT family N-acetyltransferase [Ktedonobacterales bacterium]